MLTAPDSPAALANTLLFEWEQRTRPVAACLASRPALLTQLAAICATLRPGAAMHITAGDLRAVLASAAAFGIGTARASGPDRAARAANAVVAGARAPGHCAPIGPAHQALLSISSPAAVPLHMDELTVILEIAQHALGPDVEIVFGHDETDKATAPDLQVWLLVGYA